MRATVGGVAVEIAPPADLVVLAGVTGDGKVYHLRYAASDHVEVEG